MLARGNESAYRRLLAGGGQFVRRLEVWKSGVRVDTFGDAGLTVFDGSLAASLENRVTRRLRLSVPASLFPDRDGDLLDPREAELVLWCGWRGGAAPAYLWPTFTGPVTAVSETSHSARISIDATDRVEQIVEDKFTAPVSSGTGTLITTKVKDLISDSQPGAVFGRFDETYAVVPDLTWEADRAQAIDDLAAGAGCFWYQLPDGTYTMRRIPWAGDTLDPAVVVLTDGVDQTVVTVVKSRTGVYTICQVTGEAATGGAPVSGTVLDTDPASPTYHLGPLGRRVLKVQIDMASTNAQAEGLARQRLRRAKSNLTQVSTSMPYDPSLELGDVATIISKRGTFSRSLAGFTANIGRNPTMSMQWRAPGGDDQ